PPFAIAVAAPAGGCEQRGEHAEGEGRGLPACAHVDKAAFPAHERERESSRTTKPERPIGASLLQADTNIRCRPSDTAATDTADFTVPPADGRFESVIY